MKNTKFSFKTILLISCALALTLTTCIVATANTNNSDKGISAKDQSPNSTLSKNDPSTQYLNTTYTTEKQPEVIQQYANNTAIVESSSSEIAEQYATRFDKYKDYGLTYDQTADNLYFNGKLVRYFEDWYPVGDDGNAGIDYFNQNGAIDVHGVRDLSQLIHNTDGSYDPSGKLTGVEPYSQAEFDARDIDKIKNPSQAITSVATDNSAQDNSYPYAASNFQLAEESNEAFKIYAEFGLTYDKDNVFRYNGKTVRRFFDEHGTLAFTREVVNDYDKSVDLTAIRDANRRLTGLSVASKEEFDQRTAKIEQSRKEWAEFLKNNPNVTSYATAEVDGAYTPNGNSNPATASYTNPNVTETVVDVTAGSYINPNYTDNSLTQKSQSIYAIYNEFGLYFDPKTNNIYYNGELVRRFYDERNSTTVTRSFNVNGLIDVTTIRNDKYVLTGLYKHTQQEFDERTKIMLGNNTTETVVDVAAASYSNSDYVDTSLNEYLDYGVSYDKTSRKWLFIGKPIDFLFDAGHQTYVNFLEDNTDINFAETVKVSNGVYLRVTRKSSGEIDKVSEMTDR